MINTNKNFIFFIVIPAIVLTSAHFLYRLIAKDPSSWPLFFAWLSLLGALNAVNGWYFWKNHKRASQKAQLFMLLWSSVSLWYWLFAPAYYFFSMNIDGHQLSLTGFAYSWEVPIIGGLFVAASMLRFNSLHRKVYSKKEVKNTKKLHRSLVRYRLEVAVLILVFSIIGYAVGAWQLGYFTQAPSIEQIKNVINGVVIAVFLAVFYYLFLGLFLNKIKLDFEKKYKIKNLNIQSFSSRLILKTSLITLGSIMLLGLIALNQGQHVLREKVTEDMQGYINNLSVEDVASGNIDPKSTDFKLFKIKTGQYIENYELSFITRDYIHSRKSGVIEDLYKQEKSIVFKEFPETGEKVIAVAQLSESYGALRSTTKAFIFGAALVLFLTIVIDIIVALGVTDSVRKLFSIINEAKKEELGEGKTGHDILPLPSSDEFSVLSQIIIDYIRELKNINETKAEFVSLASHQLRTPLTIMKWYTDMLENEDVGKLNKHQKEYLKQISDANQRLIMLVKDLLNLSRLELDTVTFKNEKIELDQFIESMLKEAKPEIEKKGLILKKDYGKGVKTIEADPALLRMIIDNVIYNGIKYNKPKGRLNISTYAENNHVLIKIHDTGVGIPNKDQGKIFNKLYRASNVQKISSTGTGLGLYLAKTILKNTGGDIWFESELGKGSVFTISLPAKGMKDVKK